MIIDDGFNKYTINSGLLAFFDEQSQHMHMYSDREQWVLKVILDWDELSDYKKFNYVTKVIQEHKETQQQIMSTIDDCKEYLDGLNVHVGQEQLIAETKEEMNQDFDEELSKQLEQMILKEYEQEFNQANEHQEFSFNYKYQLERQRSTKEVLENSVESEKQKEQSEEEKIQIQELKQQAKQKVSKNPQQKKNTKKATKKQNNTKKQKQQVVEPQFQQEQVEQVNGGKFEEREDQQNKDQKDLKKEQVEPEQQEKHVQFVREKLGTLIIKKEIPLDNYIKYYTQKLKQKGQNKSNKKETQIVIDSD